MRELDKKIAELGLKIFSEFVNNRVIMRAKK